MPLTDIAVGLATGAPDLHRRLLMANVHAIEQCPPPHIFGLGHGAVDDLDMAATIGPDQDAARFGKSITAADIGADRRDDLRPDDKEAIVTDPDD